MSGSVRRSWPDHVYCFGCPKPFSGEDIMEESQIGWIAAIIVGGIAGWLAEQFMHGNWACS
jgi:hypothetical protein